MEEVKKGRQGNEGRRRELAKIVYANQRRAIKNVFFSSVVIVISLLTYFAYSLSFYFHIFFTFIILPLFPLFSMLFSFWSLFIFIFALHRFLSIIVKLEYFFLEVTIYFMKT